MTTDTTTRPTSASRSVHRCAQGFCTVCGSTWPCWRGTLDGGSFATSRMTAVSLELPRC